MTAHDAYFDIVTSRPSVLKKPFSRPITIDEQSVRAMMPMRMLDISGASDANTRPRHPTGSWATSAPSAESFKSSRRESAGDDGFFLFDTFRFLSLGLRAHRDGGETAHRRSEQDGAGSRIERGVMTRALEAGSRGGPHDRAPEVRAATIERNDVAGVEPNGKRRTVRTLDRARLAGSEVG